jgi:hypothetical protein
LRRRTPGVSRWHSPRSWEKAGFTPEELSTNAALTMEQVDGNWTIKAIHLEVTGRVPEH